MNKIGRQDLNEIQGLRIQWNGCETWSWKEAYI